MLLFSTPLGKSVPFPLFIYNRAELVPSFPVLRDGNTRAVRVSSMNFVFNKRFITGFFWTEANETRQAVENKKGQALLALRCPQSHTFTSLLPFSLISLLHLKSPYALTIATLRSQVAAQVPSMPCGRQGQFGAVSLVALGILSDMWHGTGKPCGTGSSANPQFWAFHSHSSCPQEALRP